MTNLRDFLGKIGFKVDHEGLDKVNEKLEGIKHRLEFLGAIEVVKGLYELTHRFAALGEQILIGSTAAGLGVENFQKLTYAAEQNGVAADEMGRGLTILAKRLYAARQGSADAQQAFAAAGFTPDQVNGFKTTQDALLGLSDNLKNIDDPIKRAALSQELLGRNSARMAGFLAKGSAAIREEGQQAKNLGLILSRPQLEALERVENAFKRLAAFLQAVGASIAAYVAPVFEYIVNDFLKFVSANKSLLDLNIQNWFVKVAGAMGFMYGIAKGLITVMLELAEKFHIDDKLLSIISSIGSFVLAIFSLSKAFSILGTILGPTITLFGFLLSPIVLIPAAIAAIILLVQELYSLFTGQPSWLDQFAEWLVSIDAVKAALGELGKAWDFVKNNFSVKGIVGGVNSFFGGKEGDKSFSPAASLQDRISSIASPAPSAGSAVASGAAGASNTEINAPMTFNNVPPGTNPKEVGDSVKQAVTDHLDRVHREARRSLVPAVAR